MTTDQQALLGLLQIADSAFPSGTFAHSYGLEQLVAEGRVEDANDLEAFVRSVVLLSVAPADATAAIKAWRCGAAGDRDGILRIDQCLYAMKASSALRAASVQAGRRTVEELAVHLPDPTLDWLLTAVRNELTPGNHAVALSIAGRACGLAAGDVAGAVMFTAANALLQSAMRLLPVSHRDVQGALHRLRPDIAARAGELASPARPLSLRAFHPVQEIAAMHHLVGEARLFAS